MEMKNVIAIFSGYNQRAVIAFLRSLTNNDIENYVIIAASDQDTILKTVYKDKVFYIRKKKELNLDEVCSIFHMIRKEYRADSILVPPTTESLNRFLLDHRHELEKRHCTIPLVDQGLYTNISDKDSFWRLCKKEGFAVPSNIEIGKRYRSPYVAKPKHYKSNDGKVYSPMLVLDSKMHETFWNNYNRDDFTYQEYLTGESFYLLYYFSTNGSIFSFSQVNYAQQLNGKSILAAAAADLHKQDICQKYIDLFRKVNYYGFVMVELRKKSGIYYMIEANPRFWGPSQLFVDAGVDFFERFLFDYGFLNQIKKTDIDYKTLYLWSGGCDTELINSGKCAWYGEGKKKVSELWEKYLRMDIYHRIDTMDIFKLEKEKLEA